MALRPYNNLRRLPNIEGLPTTRAPNVTKPLRRYSWPLSLLTINRLGLFLLVYVSLLLMPLSPNIDGFRLFPDNQFLDGWGRWDTAWYVGIAEEGYRFEPLLDEQRNIVFFPLYPLTIRALDLLVHNTGLSGFLVSNLAFVIAFLLLFRLVKECYGTRVARWSLLLLACYPFSFYFSAIYSEALFFLFVVTTFHFIHRRQWGWAALFAAFAGATRLVGIALILPMLIAYLDEIDYRLERVGADILWLLVAPMGAAAYVVFLWYRFDAPLAFATTRNVDGWETESLLVIPRSVASLFRGRAVLTGEYPALDLLNFGVGLLAVLVLILASRRLNLAHVVWALASLVLAFAGGGWDSMGRYVLPLFPVFAAIPLLVTRPYRLLALAYLFTIFLALFAIMFTHWYFVT